MTFRPIIILLSILAFAGSVGAQPLPTASADSAKVRPEFVWSIDFNTVFDNREGDSRYTRAQTIFMTQLAPEVGVRYGAHTLKGGVVYNQPIGNEWRGYKISPTIYYSWQPAGSSWSLNLGMFSRERLVRPMPDYIYSDSARYVQRNIRGAAVQSLGERGGFFEAVLDWRQLQDDSRREAFEIIARGEWVAQRRIFLAGGLLMMNHLARSARADESQHVVDNFIANPYVGVDMRSRWPAMTEASLRVGALTGMTRDRGDSDWLTRGGLWLDANAEWRGLGVHDNLYAGGKFFPLAPRYGTLLNEGEPYYASNFYNRTDLYYRIIRRGPFDLRVSLDFHLAKENFTFYQRVLLAVRF